MSDKSMNDKPMSEKTVTDPDLMSPTLDEEQQGRRDFLIGLGRWSKVVIGAAIFGGLAARESEVQAGAWVNRRGGGGGWVNGRVGGGGWINGRGGGGGSWVNRR
ncbi:hypothetical protein [Thiorhodococcus mannitoliphagus]|nr:hypothetical protein [Thiorhodococcus mannitoliphagus]